MTSENLAYISQINKINSNLNTCENECDKKDQKVIELQKANNNYGIIQNIKKDMNFVNDDISKFEKKLIIIS